MMDNKDAQPYEWKYLSKEILTPKDFLRRLATVFEEKEIVSVGEAHDVNDDSSYGWLQSFKGDILQAFSSYRLVTEIKGGALPRSDFERSLPPDSKLLRALESHPISFKDLAAMHPGRLFAVGVLPLSRFSGFTELVLEGEIAERTDVHFQRSKDTTGDLLRLTIGMIMGMRIHSAYAGGFLSTVADVGQAVYHKITEIKKNNPQAKILAYNGAMHNMTKPFQGRGQEIPGIAFDLAQITYAPQLIKDYGDRYAAIDLLGAKPLPESHFAQMQREAEGEITCFTHGQGQMSFVIKPGP